MYYFVDKMLIDDQEFIDIGNEFTDIKVSEKDIIEDVIDISDIPKLMESDDLCNILEEPSEDLGSILEQPTSNFNLEELKKLIGPDLYDKIIKNSEIKKLLKSENKMEAIRKIMEKLPKKEKSRIKKMLTKQMKTITNGEIPKVEDLVKSFNKESINKNPYSGKYKEVTKNRKVINHEYGFFDNSEVYNNNGKISRFIQESMSTGKNRLASKLIGKPVYGNVMFLG